MKLASLQLLTLKLLRLLEGEQHIYDISFSFFPLKLWSSDVTDDIVKIYT